MNRVEVLTAKLNTLQEQVTRIRSEGDYLQGMRLEKAAAGGTASKGAQATYNPHKSL